MKRHMILALAAAVCAAYAAGRPQPARANVTSVTIAPASQSVGGLCPAAVKFTATITGSPGSASFKFFGTGGAPDGQTMTVTIPASGSTTVTDAEPVSVDGTFKRQALAQQGNLVYSNQVTFTSTCSTIIINPGILGGGSGGTQTSNHPINLHATNDAKECGNHNGSFACAGVLYNDLVLVWDYNPAHRVCIGKIGGPEPKCSSGDDLYVVDGYKMYRVDGGRHDFLRAQQPQGITAFDVGKASDGQCFAVTSYHGSAESSPSNAYCVGGGTPIGPTTTLRATQWGSRYKHYSANDFGTLRDTGAPCGSGFCTGWYHHKGGSCPLNCDHENFFWRSYFRFDPGAIAGRYIGKATLLLHANPSDQCVNFVAYIAAADRDWWDNTDMVGGDFHSVSGAINPTNLSLDVTQIVRGWARGDANNGFVLRGLYEDQGAEDNSRCYAELDKNAALRIDQ